MKKMFSVVLLLVLSLCPMLSSIAENKTKEMEYDSSWFEGLDGYEYDKFDKQWRYSEYVSCFDKGYYCYCYLHLLGNESSILKGGPTLIVQLFTCDNNKKEIEKQYQVTSVDILIGDKVFSYPKFDTTNGCVRIGKKDKDFIEAISETTEMSIRVKSGSMTISWDVSSEDLAKWKKFAIRMLQFDVWKFATDEDNDVAYCEEHYPLIKK